VSQIETKRIFKLARVLITLRLQVENLDLGSLQLFKIGLMIRANCMPNNTMKDYLKAEKFWLMIIMS
jgi:hypothetical protein